VALSFVTILVWSTNFLWWALIVCLIIPLFWMVPIGMVQAMTNIAIGLNVITEFIVGYMTPGRPLAMMMFKTYGYMTMYQGLSFVQDLKLGHYMKIPPRTMFASQTVATLWSSIVQVAVMKWALSNIADVCAPDQPNNYTCPNGQVFFTASIIWGAIGPARMFSPGAVYSSLMWYFLIGATLPVLTWLAARRYPKSAARYLMVPVMFGGVGYIPPSGAYNYLCWGLVGFIFQYYIRRHYFGWFKQYNYVTAAALDTGLILSTIIIFFTLQLTLQTAPQWYGKLSFAVNFMFAR
jgi:OPT family small oligopeptide transporter